MQMLVQRCGLGSLHAHNLDTRKNICRKSIRFSATTDYFVCINPYVARAIEVSHTANPKMTSDKIFDFTAVLKENVKYTCRGIKIPSQLPSNYEYYVHANLRLSPQIGAGPSSAQRVVKPGQGLVGNVAAAGTPGVAVVVMDPSKEEAFCQEVDLPRAMEGKTEPTGER